MRKRQFRPLAAGGIGATATLVLCLLLAGVAAAATGGAGTPVSAATPRGSAAGAPSSTPSAGALTLLSARTSPRKAFYFGFRYPRLTYTIGSSQADNDLRIAIVNAAGESVKTYYREDVAPGIPNTIRWDGTTDSGRPAPNGRYSFVVSAQTEGAPPARPQRRARRNTEITTGFAFYGYSFPILGAHSYGLSAGRFGAGRSGHTHQGQDVMAACGTPLVAARGGTVLHSKWHAAAGNYVVIDGRRSRYDFMYAHLAAPSPLKPGDTVRTGQPIGIVGSTGSSTACHLHFEMWDHPGWYLGGSPLDPRSFLQRWDRYS